MNKRELALSVIATGGVFAASGLMVNFFFQLYKLIDKDPDSITQEDVIGFLYGNFSFRLIGVVMLFMVASSLFLSRNNR